MGRGEDVASLTEEERRALRGSKFAPLPSHSHSSSSRPQQQQQPRLAHPGGPVTTNKAAALAKFLERKLQKPDGLNLIKPELLELAVRNAKEAVHAGGTSGRIVRHVSSFEDSSEDNEEDKLNDVKVACKPKSKKKAAAKADGLMAKAKSKKKKKKKKKREQLSASEF